jgi:hypothetical protein
MDGPDEATAKYGQQCKGEGGLDQRHDGSHTGDLGHLTDRDDVLEGRQAASCRPSRREVECQRQREREVPEGDTQQHAKAQNQGKIRQLAGRARIPTVLQVSAGVADLPSWKVRIRMYPSRPLTREASRGHTRRSRSAP